MISVLKKSRRIDSLKHRIDVIAIFLIGALPLLWYKPDYVIAKGDYFPYTFLVQGLSNDLYSWSTNALGAPSVSPAFSLYGLLWAISLHLGIGIGLWQIMLRILYIIAAMFSMRYLAKTVYPGESHVAFIASFFYVFNFFILSFLLVVGMMWTYALLPLLIAFFIKAVTQTKNRFANIVRFSVVFTVVASISSMNLTNIVLILVILAIVLLYYVVFERKIGVKQLSKNMILLLTATFLLCIWWMFPLLNYYALSGSIQLQSQVNVLSWSWTHQRASFLNLFALNGGWSWRPEYFPYYESYSNPVLLVSIFVPFLLASTALLHKSGRSRLNSYMMLVIIIFVFLAKGLHEPFGQLNLLLYNYIPSMSMFREPTSKFTMALMPFLALLVGYAVNFLAKSNSKKVKRTSIAKKIVAAFFVALLIAASFPLLTNPIETKTEQLPFSSYVKIPGYWYQATEWLNNGSDNYKILVTPPDDFYQMPYTWGYYGADQFIERLIQRPIICNHYAYAYKTNPETLLTLQQITNTIRYNKTGEFKDFLDLLNIKYILQRNDLQHNLTGRNIISPNKMQAFLSQQPYIKLAKKIGQLDIYEYADSKPYIYTLQPSVLQKTTIRIQNTTTLERTWNFGLQTDIADWQKSTLTYQWQAYQQLSKDNNTLKIELWNSTWGWKTINSIMMPATYGNRYTIQTSIRGQNAHSVHIKIGEYDQNKNILTTNYAAYVNDGTFDWTNTLFSYEPTNETTRYLQIQIWHGHETPKPLPNIIWVGNVQIEGYETILNTNGLDSIFENTLNQKSATVMSFQKTDPTRIVATVNATQPFVLVVSESLDSSWTAYVNGKQYKPIQLYLGLKGFSIDQTGLLDVAIEYEPQRWFFFSSIVSVTTLLACVAYLIYCYTGNKAVPKRTITAVERNKSKMEPETSKVNRTL